MLPDGFKHIRSYGLLANRHRTARLATCRRLLGVVEWMFKTNARVRRAVRQYRIVMEEFAYRVRDEVDLSQLSERLVSGVDDTMRPESVGLWLRPGVGSRTETAAEPGGQT